LLRDETKNRVIQTSRHRQLHAFAAGCQLQEVRAWDTGPGNMVIDECARALFGVAFDKTASLRRRASERRGFIYYGDLARCIHFLHNKASQTLRVRDAFGVVRIAA
jgi:anhydro-N-acetylmuramic acid kinase